MTYEEALAAGGKPSAAPVQTPYEAALAAGGKETAPEPAKPPKPVGFLEEVGNRVTDTLSRIGNDVSGLSLPTSLEDAGRRVKQNAKAAIAPIGDAVLSANRQVAHDLAHPVETFRGGPLAQSLGLSTPEDVARREATNREALRGVNANIPFANLAVEHLGGPAEVSPADQALAPDALAFGAISGAPVAGMLGQSLGGAGGMVGDAVGSRVRAVGEGSIARSAARAAENPTPVRAAIKDVGAKLKGGAKEIAMAAIADSMMGGHKLAGAAAALKIGAPVAKAAKVALDEGTAAMFRRFLKVKATEVPPAPAAAAAAVPVAEAVPVAAPPPAPVVQAVPSPAAAVEAPAKAAPRRRSRAAPKSQLEANAPAPAPEAAPVVEAAPEPAPAAPVEPQKPLWQPGPDDEKYAKPLGLSVEKYRTIMAERTARLAPISGMAPEAEMTLRKFVAAADAGNTFARKQLAVIANSKQGAARIATVKSQMRPQP